MTKEKARRDGKMMPEWEGAGSSTLSGGQHQEQQTGYTSSDASNWFTPEATPTHNPTPQATPTPTPTRLLYFWERNGSKHEDSANDNQTTPRQATAQPAFNALPPSMGTPVAWSAGHGNHGYYGYEGAANSYGSEYGSNGYGTNHGIQGVSSGASSSASGAQAYQSYPGAHQSYPGAHQSYPGAHQSYPGAYPEVYSGVYPDNYSNNASTSNTQQYIRNVNEAHQAYPTDYSNNTSISNTQQYAHDGELANAEEGRSNQS
ncbi:hypothetical protein VKT23_014539 [Stygiomarasmius scandens]|uniref:Uncharacterized protein n=1 Tax=Marasmiellus scandens TaxID=2682957 RepID=A0ABR1J2M2_9AGAR